MFWQILTCILPPKLDGKGRVTLQFVLLREVRAVTKDWKAPIRFVVCWSEELSCAVDSLLSAAFCIFSFSFWIASSASLGLSKRAKVGEII